MKKLIFISIGILVVIGISLFLERHPAFVASVSPQREPFTELYFNDSSELLRQLPSKIVKGTTVSFSFTVHNLEGKDMTYPYKVYVIVGGKKVLIQQGIIAIKSDLSQTIKVTYTFKNSYVRAQFLVMLPELNQDIHFFIPNE